MGGPAALAKALSYPETARKDSLQGIVYVEATVDKDGNVVKATVVKGVREDLDKASIEAVRSVKFTPGRYKGKPTEAIVSYISGPKAESAGNLAAKAAGLFGLPDARATADDDSIPF